MLTAQVMESFMEASQKKTRTPRLVRGSQKPTMNTLHREGVCVGGSLVTRLQAKATSYPFPSFLQTLNLRSSREKGTPVLSQTTRGNLVTF